MNPKITDVDRIRDYLAGLVPASTPFLLRRTEDPTGVSGTGVVADGVIFPDMRVATRWRAGALGVAQTCVWDRLSHVRQVHGHGGATRIEMVPVGALVEAVDRVVREIQYHRAGGDLPGVVADALLREITGSLAEFLPGEDPTDA